jgi:hypothetical protein
MRKLLVLLVLFICSFSVKGQTLLDTTFAGWKAVVWLPPAYYLNNNADSSLQCIVFTYGVTQAGTAPYSSLKTYGPIAYLLGGWNGGVTLGNGTHYPIIIGLQQNPAYSYTGQPLAKLDAIRARYKIKKGNLHGTGWSAGGHMWKALATEDAADVIPPYGPFTYADAFKSIVDFQGVVPDEDGVWYTKVKNFAHNNVTGGGKYLGIWGTADGDRQIPRFKDSMNAAVPNSGFVVQTTDGHNTTAVNKAYGSLAGVAPINYTIGGVSQTVYQWMLRQGDTTLGMSPIVTVRSDTTITLPVNTVTLTGSAADPDGTISSYLWSQVSGPSSATIPSPFLNNTVAENLIQGTYVFKLTATDNTGQTGNASVTITVLSSGEPVANAGTDTLFYKNQIRPDTAILRGTASINANTYFWEKISGPNNPTIAAPSGSISYVYNLLEGTYQFKLTVNNTSFDTVNVVVIDYMKKNQRPCRVGTPQAFDIPLTNATEIYRPYITRDNVLPSMLGGDTLYIPAGTYSSGIELGDFGGSEGCPIIVAPKNGIVYITNNSNFRFGIRDSNVVCHVKVDGTLKRSSGTPYGFISTHTAIQAEGLTANLVHHFEVAGLYVYYKDVGIFIKKNSAVYKFTQYDKFLLRKITLHDNYVHRIAGEGYYIGHTDNTGTQPGNSSGYGPPPRGDSIVLYNNIADSTGWDGMQISNALNGVKVYNNLIYRAGQTNASSQQHGIIVGSNINSPQIYNNFVMNVTGGGISMFSYGSGSIYNNILDSVARSGTGAEKGIYTKRNNVSPENPPALAPIVTGNFIEGSENSAVYTDYPPTTSGGNVSNNWFLNNTPNNVQNNSGATVNNNTTLASFPLNINSITRTGSTGYVVSVTQGATTITFNSIQNLVNWTLERVSGITPYVPPKFPRTKYRKIIAN